MYLCIVWFLLGSLYPADLLVRLCSLEIASSRLYHLLNLSHLLGYLIAPLIEGDVNL